MRQTERGQPMRSRLEDDLYNDPNNLPTSILVFILIMFLVLMGIAGFVIWVLSQSAGTGGFGYG